MKKLLAVLFEKDIDSSAAQVAFYFLIALFPFLFIISKLTAIFSISNDSILELLFFVFPENTYQLIYQNLQTLTANSDSVMIFISILLALWSASRVTNALKKTFGYNYPEPIPMNLVYTRLISVLFTMIFAFLVLFSFFALLLLNVISGFITTYFGIGAIANLLSMIVTVGIAVVDLVFIYMYLPPKRIPFKAALPGAVFSTIGFWVASFAFSYYVNNIANFTRLYGALASLVILMLWLYICSYIIILGGEINNLLIVRRK